MERDRLLVLADELSQRGDPHGELISVQLALESDPHNRELATRDAVLRDRVVGSLPRGIRLTWTGGFVTTLHLWPGSLAEVTGKLPELLSSYALSRLVSVALGPCDDPDPLFAALANLPATVERLDARLWQRGTRTLPPRVGDLSALSGHPRLAALRLHAGSVRLRTLELPRLRELEIVCTSQHPSQLPRLSGSVVPRLERLTLSFGVPFHPFDPDEAARAVVEKLPDSGSLRELSLLSCDFGDGLCRLLPEAPWLTDLESLTLAHAGITDSGAEALLAAAPSLAHLRVLDLRGNAISPSWAERLGAALPSLQLGTQRGEIARGGPDEEDTPEEEEI